MAPKPKHPPQAFLHRHPPVSAPQLAPQPNQPNRTPIAAQPPAPMPALQDEPNLPAHVKLNRPARPSNRLHRNPKRLMAHPAPTG